MEDLHEEGMGRRSLLKRGAAATGIAVGALAAAPLVAPDPAFATTGDVLEGWYDVTSHGLVGDNSTDNTSALQSLITTVVGNGGGTIYFPPGVFRFSSAMTTAPHGGNVGLLVIPYVAPVTSAKQVTLEFVGATPPRGTPAVVGINTLPPTAGTVLICGTSQASTTGGNFILGDGGAGDFSWLNLIMRRLTIRLPNQTTWSAINAQWTGDVILEDVNVDVDVADGSVGYPPNGTIGVITPGNANGAKTRLTNCGAVGYYYGFWLCEHSEVDGLWAYNCQSAYVITDADHGYELGRIQALHCTHAISASNAYGRGGAPVTGGPLDIEDGPTGTWAPGTHIVDSGNILYGDLSFVRVQGGIGHVTGPLSTSGAAHIQLRNVLDNVIPIPNTTAVPAASLGAGGYLYVSGGALKYRGSSGTVTTLAPA